MELEPPSLYDEVIKGIFMSTICNPVNLSYRFQLEGISDQCCREAADPSVVYFEGKLWLFASKSSGYWWADDVREWHFISTSTLPAEDYAPDVRVMDGWLYCTASRHEKACPIYRTKNPMEDQWELVSKPFPFWDPNMFQDDDGRVYLYWGCSDIEPIYGVEMDLVSMLPKGEPVALFGQNHDKYGWERKSENNCESVPPHIEGPWMTKHDGKYYLQYAGPGTEFNTYADGTYIGESPLGPFAFAQNNPYSYKPGGYITGAGHGSTFEDKYGNLWHISTMRISMKHMFERRLGIWPAGFDADGDLFCNTRFGDWPQRVVEGKWEDPWKDLSPGWMLLSYGKPVRASSFDGEHSPNLISNEDVRTYWAADQSDERPWLVIDLEKICSISAIQVNFAEHLCKQYGLAEGMQHRYRIEGSVDESTWDILIEKSENEKDVPHDYVELPSDVSYRYLRITVLEVPAKGRPALSGVRVFGNACGKAPSQPILKSASCLEDDELSALVQWEKVPSAVGYNIRWGYTPEKLYHDWLVYEQDSLVLPALHKGQNAYVAVEAFNDSGVSLLSDTIEISNKEGFYELNK